MNYREEADLLGTAGDRTRCETKGGLREAKDSPKAAVFFRRLPRSRLRCRRFPLWAYPSTSTSKSAALRCERPYASLSAQGSSWHSHKARPGAVEP